MHILEDITDSARAPRPHSFVPPPGLANAHFQSVAARVPWYRRRVAGAASGLLDAARSEIVDCGGGIRLQGFYSEPRTPARGLVVLLHGWEGCADSVYMLSLGAALFEASFAVFRLNFRDHGDTFALNEGLFHSCRVDEVVAAVKAVQARHPAPGLAIVGHSLGGNFAARVGVRAPAAGIALDRVIGVCPVLQPQSTMRALEEGLWIYRQFFLRRWRQSLETKAALFPALYDFGDLSRLGTLTETTDFFVRRYTDFASLDEYLSGYALTGRRLEPLTVPTRLILAADDPVIPSADVARLARPRALTVEVTRRGGHCGFVQGYALDSWADLEVLRDLEASMPAR